MASSLKPTRGNYKRYTLDQKERAVKLAAETTFANASEHLKIPTSTILSWKRRFEAGLTGVYKRTGLKITYDVETDNEIRDWVIRQRDCNLPVTKASLSDYARKVIRRPGFKATDGWMRHFLKRHNLSLRTRTTTAQELPEDLERRIEVFHQHITELRLEKDFANDCIINMDETAVFFDLVPTRTIAVKGQKTVGVRSTGAEKRHLTVALAITASGATLPPLVIFKGKWWPSDINAVPEGIHVRMQEKGWMTEEIMLSWLESTVAPYTRGRPTLLVMDSFAGHTTPDIRKKLSDLNVSPAVIPGGCTSKIQPLDVSINKPFKDHLRRLWSARMAETPAQHNGRIPTASRQTVIDWVKSAWTDISRKPSMVVKAFETCGILTAVDAAKQELDRRNRVLASALFSDSEDEEFLGFGTEDAPFAHLDSDSRNPFLE